MPQFTEMRRPALWNVYEPAAAAPRTVVLGYDGSHCARRAAVRAAEAARRGGRVVVVTAVPPAELLLQAHEGDLLIGDPDSLIEDASALLRPHDVAVSRRVEQADPTDALVAAASEAEATLIVVGARGESYLARALRGSVGERLVARAPCDVLVVR